MAGRRDRAQLRVYFKVRESVLYVCIVSVCCVLCVFVHACVSEKRGQEREKESLPSGVGRAHNLLRSE